MTVQLRTKTCPCCKTIFSERKADSHAQWASQVFCSKICGNASRTRTPLPERYWRRVTKSAESDCWGWMGATDGRGYGAISGVGNAPKKAHRVSWEIHFGSIPAGMGVLHKCDNPKCSNPAHLFLGTQRDNCRDMASKGRINPRSFLNLQPGRPGYHGAGPTSNKELQNGISQ